MVGVEGPDHGEAALEGLDEVAVLLLDHGFIRHARPPAARRRSLVRRAARALVGAPVVA